MLRTETVVLLLATRWQFGGRCVFGCTVRCSLAQLVVQRLHEPQSKRKMSLRIPALPLPDACIWKGCCWRALGRVELSFTVRSSTNKSSNASFDGGHVA